MEIAPLEPQDLLHELHEVLFYGKMRNSIFLTGTVAWNGMKTGRQHGVNQTMDGSMEDRKYMEVAEGIMQIPENIMQGPQIITQEPECILQEPQRILQEPQRILQEPDVDLVREIGILGLGLIGGSLAKSLKAGNRNLRIVAYDPNTMDVERAQAEHVVDVVAREPGAAFAKCAVVFLCTPVSVMRTLTLQLLPHLPEDTILLDTGSTKQEVMALFKDLGLQERFIGGHPMAGSERSGYAASRANLFENAWFVLTPFDQTPEKRLQRVMGLIARTGAMPIRMHADEHDRATAHISHLPHVVATLLVDTVASAEDASGTMQRLAAGGFKDLTRIASSSPELWTGICLSNRAQLMDALQTMRQALSDFSQSLSTGDAQQLQRLFSQGRDWRNRLSDLRVSRVPGYAEITVDVEDKPGIIARIALALEAADINIKNIGINNVREDDEGALLIRFENLEEGEQATQVLTRAGYVVKRRK